MREKVVLFLALEIAALQTSLNMAENLNIQKHQIPLVAEQLAELFPAESLEDFVLCFKRAMASMYGTIYRLDGPVITNWMRKYLEEKYTYVEAENTRTKAQAIQNEEVNYEAFKKRAAELFQNKKSDRVQGILNDANYVKKRVENPYTYFNVRGVQIYATSQTHAEELAKRLVELGELVEENES